MWRQARVISRFNDTLLNVLPATLYLVATPIGNLEDITLRALRILRDEVSVIACEDTRQTRKLLDHYQIRKRLISYHEHNEAGRAAEILEVLRAGDSVAVVSDAGTPLVSDPGYRAVSAAVQAGFPVVPLPGASALLVALGGSGFSTEEFCFAGFLPSKSGARRRALERIAGERLTVVVYEAPHRILETLAQMAMILGDRKIAIARELTKIHEEFLRGSAAEIRAKLEQRGGVRGEFTIVIGPVTERPRAADPAADVMRLESEGLSRMDAVKSVAKQFGLAKRDVYRLAMERDSNPSDKNPA